MSYVAGIWIDHEKAVIVSASGGRVTTKTLTSGVEPHPRYSGQRDGEGEKKYEARHGQQLGAYYEEVLAQLGQPEALLIFGPGEARLEFKACLDRASALSQTAVDVESSDSLTEPRIVAKVKEHFGIAR